MSALDSLLNSTMDLYQPTYPASDRGKTGEPTYSATYTSVPCRKLERFSPMSNALNTLTHNTHMFEIGYDFYCNKSAAANVSYDWLIRHNSKTYGIMAVVDLADEGLYWQIVARLSTMNYDFN